jgi:hypothetical protein
MVKWRGKRGTISQYSTQWSRVYQRRSGVSDKGRERNEERGEISWEEGVERQEKNEYGRSSNQEYNPNGLVVWSLLKCPVKLALA